MGTSSPSSLARAPGAGSTREARAARHAEIAPVPGETLDLDAARLDAQQVERIRFAAPAHRRRGTRLHDERRIGADRVARGGVADVARVQMASEQEGCAALTRPPLKTAERAVLRPTMAS